MPKSIFDIILNPPDHGKTIFNAAKERFPILGEMDLGVKYNPGAYQVFLESWPGDEEGTPDHPRPAEFPLGKQGVEIYNPQTSIFDIMADVTSHFLKDSDPTVNQHYRTFEKSLTKEQHEILKEQYAYHKENYGEKRPYDDWYEHTGLPGYFRGYAFKQWDDPEAMYTTGQMQDFDSMMRYLGSSR